MKTLRGILTICAVLGILGAAFYAMQLVSARHSAAQKAAAGPRDRAVTVRTAKVGRADIDHILTFNGDVEAMREVQIQPRISGRLEQLQLQDGTPVEEGVAVKQGQQIGLIDQREYHAALSTAEGAVAAAKASLSVANATLEQKRSNYTSAVAATASAQASYQDKARELERQRNLLNARATTKQNFDQASTAFAQAEANLKKYQADQMGAEAQVRSAEAAIQQSQADLKQAEAKLEAAQINYQETRILAPMDGVISQRHVDPGAMLSSSTPIVSIVAVKTVKVLLSVPVNHLPQIIPGKTQATLRTASMPGKGIPCTVHKIHPTVNTATRTARIELRVENIPAAAGGYELRPGMYASVEMLLEHRAQVVSIDISLPIRNLDRELVYLCQGDTVKAVPLKLGIRLGDQVEVLEGLAEGDEIVVQGQHRLTDGAAIRRVNQ